MTESEPLKLPNKSPEIKLNLGCGFDKKDGFKGVDKNPSCFPDIIHDLNITPWPFEDESVDEIFCSHVYQYLTPQQRITFMNECYRILKSNGKMTIIAAYWMHQKSILDPFVQYPPISEVSFAIFDKEWRDRENLPECGITSNFNAVCGHGLDPEIIFRSQEYQQFSARNFANSVSDLHANLTKK